MLSYFAPRHGLSRITAAEIVGRAERYIIGDSPTTFFFP